MKRDLRSIHPWLVYPFLGGALYLLSALGGSLYAARAGTPRWETVVTLCEWVAAMMLLPKVIPFLFGVLSEADVKSPGARRVHRWINRGALAAGALFALSVLTRAVLGLGFKPF